MDQEDMERFVELRLYRAVVGIAVLLIVGLSGWQLWTINQLQVQMTAIEGRQKHAVLSKLGVIEKNMASAQDLAALAMRVGRLESSHERLTMIVMARDGGDATMQLFSQPHGTDE